MADSRTFSLEKSSVWLLGVVAPVVMIAIILFADAIEGPKTAYVGVLSAVPMFSAVFGKPRMTAFVSIVTWLSAFTFGKVASDGNVRAQTVRLIIIAIFGVIAIIASAIRVRQDKRLAEAKLRASQADVMEEQAHTDPLTGLLNRRGVVAALGDTRDDERTLAIFDIDRLKYVNDEFGHLVGDDFISSVGARIARGFSRDDVVGRWGGDEFVVILDLPLAEGSRVVERVFAEVTAQPFSNDALTLPIGVSVGITGWSSEMSVDNALAIADRSLYEAKSDGRNRIVVAWS